MHNPAVMLLCHSKYKHSFDFPLELDMTPYLNKGEGSDGSYAGDTQTENETRVAAERIAADEAAAAESAEATSATSTASNEHTTAAAATAGVSGLWLA